MKTWAQFNEAVSDLLLVDGLRKGRGVERFRDRMILAGVRDLPMFLTIGQFLRKKLTHLVTLRRLRVPMK